MFYQDSGENSTFTRTPYVALPTHSTETWQYTGADQGLKLCGVVDMLEGKDGIQRHLDRLGRWACVHLIKFNKAKCKVLAHVLGQSQAQI